MSEENLNLLVGIDKKVDEVKDKLHSIEIVQVRMENDLKYHIKRTDILEQQVFKIEEKIQPAEAAKQTLVNLSKLLAIVVGIGAALVSLLNFIKK
jgi:hypothetical protein